LTITSTERLNHYSAAPSYGPISGRGETFTTTGAGVKARKKLGISQKNLADRIKKEDGQSISPQYLNDIERDRRLVFLRHHRAAIAAMDFFTVPTLTFSVLYCLFVWLARSFVMRYGI
jgi:hypothetical protein